MDAALNNIVSRHAGRLRALVGQSVEFAHVVWCEEADGSWIHGGSPVVLRVNGQVLELWSLYVAGLAISWDTLDLARHPFYWIGRPEPTTRWTDGADENLALAPRRGPIRQIRLLTVENQLCDGIEFTFDDGGLFVGTWMDYLVIEGAAPTWATGSVAI